MKRALAIFSMLCAAGTAHAQVDRATLSGEVRDASGGAIVGATIVVTHSATNIATRTTTNAEGRYLAVDLRPGRHVVTAEALGTQQKR